MVCFYVITSLQFVWSSNKSWPLVLMLWLIWSFLCIVQASALEGTVFTHSDVKPGMVVRAKIIAVKSFGATVQFPGQLKALCPLSHMSEFEIAKPRKKFKVTSWNHLQFLVHIFQYTRMVLKLTYIVIQVGAELLFRVLGCKKKMITVTHKKTLVCSFFFDVRLLLAM